MHATGFSVLKISEKGRKALPDPIFGEPRSQKKKPAFKQWKTVGIRRDFIDLDIPRTRKNRAEGLHRKAPRCNFNSIKDEIVVIARCKTALDLEEVRKDRIGAFAADVGDREARPFGLLRESFRGNFARERRFVKRAAIGKGDGVISG